MIEAQRNITFFTPTLQRTGSEIVLYNLLTHLPSHFNATVVSKYPGELYYSLAESINTDYIYGFYKPATFIVKAYYKLFKKKILENKLKKYKDSTWYVNTIVLPEIIDFAVKNNIKLIVHVHELQQMYSVLSDAQIKQLVSYPKLLIANSNASKAVLESYGATSKINICYPAIDTTQINFNEKEYFKTRKKLNISEATFVWAMVGTLDENKNPELFIDIAVELKKKYSDFKMLWIGSSSDESDIEGKYKNEAERKEADDKIAWITETNKDYKNYFNCADGFVLTSKLESFSLVTLEALLLGLPIVANNCIGVNEILNQEYGSVINNTDAVQMSIEMQEVMQKPVMRNIKKGREIAEKFDIRVWQQKWVELLNNYIYNKS